VRASRLLIARTSLGPSARAGFHGGLLSWDLGHYLVPLHQSIDQWL
jgi:hypothetical protein